MFVLGPVNMIVQHSLNWSGMFRVEQKSQVDTFEPL